MAAVAGYVGSCYRSARDWYGVHQNDLMYLRNHAARMGALERTAYVVGEVVCPILLIGLSIPLVGMFSHQTLRLTTNMVAANFSIATMYHCVSSVLGTIALLCVIPIGIRGWLGNLSNDINDEIEVSHPVSSINPADPKQIVLFIQRQDLYNGRDEKKLIPLRTLDNVSQLGYFYQQSAQGQSVEDAAIRDGLQSLPAGRTPTILWLRGISLQEDISIQIPALPGTQIVVQHRAVPIDAETNAFYIQRLQSLANRTGATVIRIVCDPEDLSGHEISLQQDGVHFRRNGQEAATRFVPAAG
jgi:hypothetical protein